MDGLHILHGGCQCGRNTYEIEIPKLEQDQLLEQAHVFLDNSELTRRYHSAPVTAHLRVPLPWFHSSTHSFFPEETHASIRRASNAPLLTIPNESMILGLPQDAYTPAAKRFIEDMRHINRTDKPALPSNHQRYFCGFCGTHMTRWDEVNRQRAEYIAVSLGSLEDRDVELLQDIGLLPPVHQDGDVPTVIQVGHLGDPSSDTNVALDESITGILSSQGAAWFESLIEDSRLGLLSRERRAGTHERDGIRVTWVVEEFDNGHSQEQQPAPLGERGKKRKTSAADSA